MASWSLTVARWKNVPIKVHAALPLGLFVFTGFRFAPVSWACMLGIVLLHELGHAWVVRLVGGLATEVMIHGFGGWCAWRGEVSKLGRAAIACGGVAAQLVLLLISLGADALGVWPHGGNAETVFWACTSSNAYMIAFNLVPIAPLDGVEAWSFPYLLGQQARRGAPRKEEAPAHEEPTDQARDIAAQLLANARKDGDSE